MGRRAILTYRNILCAKRTWCRCGSSSPPGGHSRDCFCKRSFWVLASYGNKGGEVILLRRMRLVLRVSVVMGAILIVSALPAAAHGFGPAFYCDRGTLNNCTDTSDPALAGDTFSCEGTAGDTLSCTNRTTGESSPYCVFLGHVSGTNRDSYLCGPEPASEQGAPQR